MTKIIRLCVGMLALAVGGFGQSLTVSPNPVILSGGATDAYVTVTWSQGNSGLSCVEVINDSGAVLATGHGGSFSVSISAVTTFTLRTCSGGTDITSVHVNVVVPAISANPSTAVAAPGAAYGATTIYWNAPGTSNVDIRLGSTTGKLFASGGTSRQCAHAHLRDERDGLCPRGSGHEHVPFFCFGAGPICAECQY